MYRAAVTGRSKLFSFSPFRKQDVNQFLYVLSIVQVVINADHDTFTFKRIMNATHKEGVNPNLRQITSHL